MADELPSADQPQKTPAKWPHDWHSYDDYLNVHTRHMENLLNEGVVLRDGLSRNETTFRRQIRQVQIRGRVECARDVIVFIDKWLLARRNAGGRIEVKGYSYSYQAFHRTSGRQILRYDSAEGLDRLHKHLFNKAGRETDREPITLSQLPSLDAFIRDAVNRA